MRRASYGGIMKSQITGIARMGVLALIFVAASLNSGNSQTAPGSDVIQPLAVFGGFNNEVPKIGPEPGEAFTDLAQGLLRVSVTDLYLPGPLPIVLTRTYRSDCINSSGTWIGYAFGKGMNTAYNMFLWSQSVQKSNGFRNVSLIMADGGQLFCPRSNSCTKSGCTDYTDAIFTCNTNPDLPWFGSVITWSSTLNGWVMRRKDGMTLTFPENHHLSSITDRNGNEITLSRDSSDHLTKISDSNGRYINLYYQDSSNPDQITQAIDSAGRSVNYTYDSNHRMISAKDADGNTTTYSWDASGGVGDLTGVTDPLGLSGTATYDSNGNLSQASVPPYGGNYSFAYTISGGQITAVDITDPDGYDRHLAFDSATYVTTDIKAKGKSEQQTTTLTRQSGTELITTVHDQLGRNTGYTYDSDGNITSVTYLQGTSQPATYTYTYDPNFAQATSMKDPLGHKWTAVVDSSNGNVTSVSDPLTDTSSWSYDSAGQVVTAKTPAGDLFSYGYDGAGDLDEVVDALNNTFKFTDDSAGRMTGFTDALSNSASFTYDAMDRLTQMTDPNGGISKFTYDADGNVTSVTDPDGNLTAYNYDFQTGTISTCGGILRSPGCLSWALDGLGHVVNYQDGRGLTTNITYDGIGRLTTESFNSSNVQGFNQTTASYNYDGGNRLTSAADTGTGSTGDTINFTYDGLDDMLSQAYSSPSLNANVNYTYDAASREQTMIAANQAQTSFSYDNADRLTGVTRGTQGVTITPDADGRRQTVTLPNGVTVAYTYDANSNVSSITYKHNGTTLGDLQYSYDDDGRVISMGGSLASVNIPSAMTATYEVGSSNFANGTSTTANQVATFNGVSSNEDNNGNLTLDPSNNGTYAWNERDQLASATVGGVTSTFQYDALGRRVQQETGLAIDNYVNDDRSAVQVQSSMSGNIDILSGLWLDDWFASTDSTGSVALLRNALGSTVALVNSSGTIATQYGYEPFGKTTASGGSTTNPYAFAGRELDASGLYFMRARYYNPLLSRFISADPIGLSGDQMNFFAYAGNGPMNFTDPLGLSGSSGPGELPAPVPDLQPGCAVSTAGCAIQGKPSLKLHPFQEMLGFTVPHTSGGFSRPDNPILVLKSDFNHRPPKGPHFDLFDVSPEPETFQQSVRHGGRGGIEVFSKQFGWKALEFSFELLELAP